MNDQNTAMSLMRMALALLDRDGMAASACHLQQAIHMASGSDATGRDLSHLPVIAAHVRDISASQPSGSAHQS